MSVNVQSKGQSLNMPMILLLSPMALDLPHRKSRKC